MVLRVNKAHSREDLINMINVGSKKWDCVRLIIKILF